VEYTPIAIVGMACRFPGADGLSEFWDLLCQGRDAIREVPAQRWIADRFYDPDPRAAGQSYVRSAGFLDDVTGFDWRAMRVAPREATAIDPQHRLLLELAWEALEDAGLPSRASPAARWACSSAWSGMTI
jgi:myxalamid-type polyketide synthase MxaE and MxaD